MNGIVDRARLALLAGAVCAVVAAVALVVSWTATGQARLVGGIASGVLGPVGVGLGAVWYRLRQRDAEG